jgi:hypothetical protein
MKLRFATLFFSGLILVAGLSVNQVEGETVRLAPVFKKQEADPLKEPTTEELRQIESAKQFILNFVAKWDWENKYRSTSDRFRKTHKTADSLKRVFNKESYPAIDFVRMEFVDRKTFKHLAAKTNLHWFAEGYEGMHTFYFVLLREGNSWVLDWLIY